MARRGPENHTLVSSFPRQRPEGPKRSAKKRPGLCVGLGGLGNALSDGLQHKTPPNHPRSLALPPPMLHWPASLPGGLGLCHTESLMLRGPMKPLFTEQTADGWQGAGTAGGASILILWPSASSSLAAPGLTPAPSAGRLASEVSLLPRAPYIACVCTPAPYQRSPALQPRILLPP